MDATKWSVLCQLHVITTNKKQWDLTCNILEVKAEQGPLTQQKGEGVSIQTASHLSSVDAWPTHYNEKTMCKCVHFYSYQILYGFQCDSSTAGFTENCKSHHPCRLTLLPVWKSEHPGHIIFVALYTAERLCYSRATKQHPTTHLPSFLVLY